MILVGRYSLVGGEDLSREEVSIPVPPGFPSGSQTNLMEDSEGAALPVENGKISVRIRPNQIVAIIVS